MRFKFAIYMLMACFALISCKDQPADKPIKAVEIPSNVFNAKGSMPSCEQLVSKEYENYIAEAKNACLNGKTIDEKTFPCEVGVQRTKCLYKKGFDSVKIPTQPAK
jgi:hypothetical protein